MTANPTADEARLGEIRERTKHVSYWIDGRCEAPGVLIRDDIPWLLDQLTDWMDAARAAEFNLRSVMKRSNHWQSRAEAAEKERDELLKHCTALERESFENLIKHEKWQEREAIYRSQIEAGAKRIDAAEKALGSAQWQPITNADKQVGPSFLRGRKKP
jgi:hypothetical protein